MKKKLPLKFGVLITSFSPLVIMACNNSASIKSKKTNKQSQSGLYYKDASNLKDNDKWWSIPNNSYSNNVTKVIGKNFYKNMKKDKDNKYKLLTIDEWYDIYDTPFDEILNDPNHGYNYVDVPRDYNSGVKGYNDIYELSKNVSLPKTGNNNNGLNGLYTGALFWIDNRRKLYDLATIEAENGGEVNITLRTKKGKIREIMNNWEHVSPASKVGDVFEENRKDRNKSESFGIAIGDLHNLRPSIGGHFNQPRANYAYGMVPGNDNKYDGVDFEIGNSAFNLMVCEPRISVRGDIARILFYMHDRYHVRYDKNYFKQLLLWARMDPVTLEEKELDKKIADVMGFNNAYVTGTKRLPYDQDVEKIVKKANADKTPNANIPQTATDVLYQ